MRGAFLSQYADCCGEAGRYQGASPVVQAHSTCVVAPVNALFGFGWGAATHWVPIPRNTARPYNSSAATPSSVSGGAKRAADARATKIVRKVSPH